MCVLKLIVVRLVIAQQASERKNASSSPWDVLVVVDDEACPALLLVLLALQEMQALKQAVQRRGWGGFQHQKIRIGEEVRAGRF